MNGICLTHGGGHTNNGDGQFCDRANHEPCNWGPQHNWVRILPSGRRRCTCGFITRPQHHAAAEAARHEIQVDEDSDRVCAAPECPMQGAAWYGEPFTTGDDWYHGQCYADIEAAVREVAGQAVGRTR